MHDRNRPSWLAAFGIVGAGGLGGALVDLFDIIALLTGGPRWLHQLDLLTAIVFTIIIVNMGAYRRRLHRTRRTTENRSGA